MSNKPNATFVRWGLVPRILEQITTGGVLCTMLMKGDGSLLSYSGEHVDKMLSAVIANIFSSFQVSKKISEIDLDISNCPNFQIIECEMGKILVSLIAGKSSEFLLIAYCSKDVDIGLVKLKLDSLSNYFISSLSAILND